MDTDATERPQVEDRLRQIQWIEVVGKLSGEVADDFGNISSTISGNLHLSEGAPDARHKEMRQTIASAVDLGATLTGRLLAFTRRQHLEPERVDLPGLVDLVGFALLYEVAMVVDAPAPPLPVRIDPGQLDSAILNLRLNAGQAIDGAGRITLTLRKGGTQVVIDVTDTGSGIALEVLTPEVPTHAMEPFFTARADRIGTGLGLSMAYSVIRQSGAISQSSRRRARARPCG